MSSTFIAVSQSFQGESETEARNKQRRQSSLKDRLIPKVKLEEKQVKKVVRTYMFTTTVTTHTFWSTLLTVIALVVSLVLGFSWRLPEVKAVVPLLDASDDIPQISVAIDFLSIDPTAGTLVADWYIFHSDCSKPEVLANIFFDENLLATDSNSNDVPSQGPPTTPFFAFNTTKRCAPTIRDNSATFRTTTKVTGNGGDSFGEASSLQNYPFDRYYAQISLFALTQNTNESVGIQVAKTFGVPVNAAVTLNTDLSSNTPDGLYIVLNITRAPSVKALVLIIFLGNWFITLSFIWIVSAALIWSAETVRELFAIPIATLFAFTSVRANLPGAPPSFGVFLDFVGILPNIALMTLTSAILIMAMLWRRVVESLDSRRRELKRRQQGDGEKGEVKIEEGEQEVKEIHEASSD